MTPVHDAAPGGDRGARGNESAIPHYSSSSEAARDYLARGWKIVPLPPAVIGNENTGKRPVDSDWPQRDYTPDQCFDNLGLILGERSGDLVDIDLDCPEAINLAPLFLPATGLRHGRPGAPGSHWYYRSKIKTQRWQSKGDGTIVEIRSTGAQTVVPPSRHYSGDLLAWESFGAPAEVSPEALRQAVSELAAASLLARHWPNGARHDAALALAGILSRSGKSEEWAETFVGRVCHGASDDETADRLAAVRTTYAASGKTTGAPTLGKLLSEEVVAKVIDWLGLPRALPTIAGDWPEPIPLDAATTPPTFPLDVLPAWMREHVEAVAEHHEVPVDLPAMLALAAGAGGASKHVTVSARAGDWQETTNLYVMVAMPSGTSKTPVLAAIMKPIRDLEKEYRADFVRARKAADEEFARRKESRFTKTNSKNKNVMKIEDDHDDLTF